MKDEAKKRKETPVFSGVINYFPDAIQEVARVSFIGNEQHNPGSDLHWDRSKSGDELDALTRHLVDAGTIDSDGIRHSAKVAWRALANLQKELEREAQEDWEEDIIKKSKVDCNGMSCDAHYCECIHDRRMNIVGQNGNDGLHYGTDEDEKGYVGYPYGLDDDCYNEGDLPGSNAWHIARLEEEDAKTSISDYPESNHTGAVEFSSYPGDIKITFDEV